MVGRLGIRVFQVQKIYFMLKLMKGYGGDPTSTNMSSHVIFPMHHIPYTPLFPQIVNSGSASRTVSLLYYFDSSSVTVPCLPNYANLHCLKD